LILDNKMLKKIHFVPKT